MYFDIPTAYNITMKNVQNDLTTFDIILFGKEKRKEKNSPSQEKKLTHNNVT